MVMKRCAPYGALLLGRAVVLLLLACLVKAKPLPHLGTVVRECEDIPEDRAGLSGVYVFLDAIHCPDPKIVRFKEDGVIRTLSTEGSITTTNLHFHVYENVTLAMAAKEGIHVKKDEESSAGPLFLVAGKLELEVGRWTPPSTDETTEDVARVVRTTKAGSVSVKPDGRAIRYTDNSVIVGDLASLRGDEEQKNGDKIEHFGNNAGDKVSMYSWKDPASEIPWTPPSTIVLLRIGVQVARSLSSSCALPLHCSVSTPRCSLKCGETLTGKLVSDCHTAALWPGIEGSVMHGTFVAGSLGETWEALLHSVAPIECNERKVLKVWRARQAMAEGKKSKSFFDWLPWGSRRGAKENAETGISLDNRGCIHSTMDGVVVLSKCGNRRWNWMNKFPWQRRKSDAYELRVSSDAIDVRRAGEYVWGIPVGDGK